MSVIEWGVFSSRRPFNAGTGKKRPCSRLNVQILTFIHIEGEADGLHTDYVQSCTITAQWHTVLGLSLWYRRAVTHSFSCEFLINVFSSRNKPFFFRSRWEIAGAKSPQFDSVNPTSFITLFSLWSSTPWWSQVYFGVCGQEQMAAWIPLLRSIETS